MKIVSEFAVRTELRTISTLTTAGGSQVIKGWKLTAFLRHERTLRVLTKCRNSSKALTMFWYFWPEIYESFSLCLSKQISPSFRGVYAAYAPVALAQLWPRIQAGSFPRNTWRCQKLTEGHKKRLKETRWDKLSILTLTNKPNKQKNRDEPTEKRFDEAMKHDETNETAGGIPK